MITGSILVMMDDGDGDNDDDDHYQQTTWATLELLWSARRRMSEYFHDQR